MKHRNSLRFLTALLGMMFLFSGTISSSEKSVKLQEDLSIGIGYGDENMMFGSVSDIQLDSEENIYLLA